MFQDFEKTPLDLKVCLLSRLLIPSRSESQKSPCKITLRRFLSLIFPPDNLFRSQKNHSHFLGHLPQNGKWAHNTKKLTDMTCVMCGPDFLPDVKIKAQD